MKIGKHFVGLSAPPFIIAEMSGNHNHSIDRALGIVKAAADAGVHALKIQTYRPDTMTLDIQSDGFVINDQKSLWSGRTLYDLYAEAHTPWEWHEEIFEYSKSLGVIPFSTPFDQSSVDFLESLDVECYKIASFEIIDIPLIKYVAQTGKPIIMSTGMATVSEIGDAVDAAYNAGCRDLVLLKCTSTYPASPKNSNVITLPHMKKLFGCEVGLSDHTMGLGGAIASIALGASVVEKHFTLSRSDGGVDSAFSMEPVEMQQLVIESKRAWESLGEVSYGPTSSEIQSLKFRRSLYVVKDVKAGELLTSENIKSIRPGLGLPPKFFDSVLGLKVARDVPRGAPVTWDIFK